MDDQISKQVKENTESYEALARPKKRGVIVTRKPRTFFVEEENDVL